MGKKAIAALSTLPQAVQQKSSASLTYGWMYASPVVELTLADKKCRAMFHRTRAPFFFAVAPRPRTDTLSATTSLTVPRVAKREDLASSKLKGRHAPTYKYAIAMFSREAPHGQSLVQFPDAVPLAMNSSRCNV